MITMLLMFLVRIVYRELMFMARNRRVFDYHGFSIERIKDSETGIFGILFNVIDFTTGLLVLYYFYYFQCKSNRINTIYYQSEDGSLFRGESS